MSDISIRNITLRFIAVTVISVRLHTAQDPLQTSIDLISAWKSEYIHHKVWDEITYPVPNFNGEVWDFISKFSPHLIVNAML